ncbi:HFD1 [[Candida] subhashii]|uniref:HFD1 n=1 Tax=[Candida] subhashii TaxID=561895 RepID=A0A8J5QCH0_9ASCO|nr:HFD1 [[Candida] subhashii]KAG7662571.1 HFD1 [[Candida] subhashii]
MKKYIGNMNGISKSKSSKSDSKSRKSSSSSTRSNKHSSPPPAPPIANNPFDNPTSTVEKPVIQQTDESTTTLGESYAEVPKAQPSWYTPLSEIQPTIQRLSNGFFQKQKTHSIQFRLNQLRNIYFAINENIDELCDALYKDFGRSPSETKNLEINTSINELVHIMGNLHKWLKPETVTDVPLAMRTNPIYIERIPLGVVLIISPFNYPFFLALSAVVGAIAAGNCVVLKQSEYVPNFSRLFGNILTNALDPDIFAVIHGGIPETTLLLDQKFDKIMYTGNNMVGKIVAAKAAETLTPTILELGGKSPAILLDDLQDKNIETVARRIIWGRFTNAGQTCVAVDYILVPSKIHDKLVEALVKIVNNEFYPNLDEKCTSYTHIIHDRAFESISKIIKTTKGKVLVGGLETADPTSRFIPPTIIDNATWEDSSMQVEIFGPVLPILTYDNLDDALLQITRHHDTPLAQYVFTSGSTNRKYNTNLDKVLTTIRSGGVIINDVLMHCALVNAPFGGVGQSGMGSYHGYFSFRNFTHERTTMEQKLWNDFLLKVRYPPFNQDKNRLIKISQESYGGNVWFNKTDDVDVFGPSFVFSGWNGFKGFCGMLCDFATKGL